MMIDRDLLMCFVRVIVRRSIWVKLSLLFSYRYQISKEHDKTFQQKWKMIDFLDPEKQPRLFGLDDYLAEHSETKIFIM